MKTKIFLFLLMLWSLTACNTSSSSHSAGQPLLPPAESKLQTKGAHLTALAFRPDGQALALAAGNTDSQGRALIEIWDTTRQGISQTLSANIGSIQSLAYSADRKWLASAGRSAGVTLWNMASGM